MGELHKIASIRGLVFVVLMVLSSIGMEVNAQSVAREWNEVLLEAIRDDYARPTVHARNLFHTSVVMYDASYLLSGAHLGGSCSIKTSH